MLDLNITNLKDCLYSLINSQFHVLVSYELLRELPNFKLLTHNLPTTLMQFDTNLRFSVHQSLFAYIFIFREQATAVPVHEEPVQRQ